MAFIVCTAHAVTGLLAHALPTTCHFASLLALPLWSDAQAYSPLTHGPAAQVCDDNFDDAAAAVVCDQLGYTTGFVSNSSAYGPGSGVIHLDNVYCTGRETSLSQCSATTSHDCTHSEDVGVACLGSASGERHAAAALLFESHWVPCACRREVQMRAAGDPTANHLLPSSICSRHSSRSRTFFLLLICAGRRDCGWSCGRAGSGGHCRCAVLRGCWSGMNVWQEWRTSRNKSAALPGF